MKYIEAFKFIYPRGKLNRLTCNFQTYYGPETDNPLHRHCAHTNTAPESMSTETSIGQNDLILKKIEA